MHVTVNKDLVPSPESPLQRGSFASNKAIKVSLSLSIFPLPLNYSAYPKTNK